MRDTCYSAWGHFNNFNYLTAQEAIGIYNRFYSLGANSTRGVYNEIYAQSGTPNNIVGNYTFLYSYNQANPQNMFGSDIQYNNVTGSAANTVYGVRVIVSGDPNTSYGINTQVPSGENHFAAYFTGKSYTSLGMWSGSDRRLKEDIKNVESGLSNIKRLRPTKYKLKAEKENRERKDHFGFIAQELMEVYPDLVQLGGPAWGGKRGNCRRRKGNRKP